MSKEEKMFSEMSVSIAVGFIVAKQIEQRVAFFNAGGSGLRSFCKDMVALGQYSSMRECRKDMR